MDDGFVLAIDQGTSSSKAVLFDSKGNIVSRASKELESRYPHRGFVEQDPMDIYRSVLESVGSCLKKFTDEKKGKIGDIAACGISNQRESFILWDRKGVPLHNAVVWNCKRSIHVCRRLKDLDLDDEINRRTGLIIDPYFSATKLMWLYENDRGIRESIEKGDAYFGTVDSWLLFKLTNGEHYCTDYTNACRTLFFNINDLMWDSFLLDKFNLNSLNLPEAKASSAFYGASDFEGILPRTLSITGMIGDSHAASFGEGCFSPGTAKATLGTGSSILLNTGDRPVPSSNGMVTTICWAAEDRVDYALEGVIVTCGATIKWLKNQLGLIEESGETEALALSVENTGGVYFIPAFSGLGAPHWKMDMKGMITGLTFGTNRSHIVRAALESIPYQIKDVIDAMEADSGIALKQLNVDGGITANRFVMQFLADILATDIADTGISDVSALGAAYMAGLKAGVYQDIDSLKSLKSDVKLFTAGEDREKVKQYYTGWQEAVRTVPQPQDTGS